MQSNGTLEQPFTINIDYEKIVQYLIDSIADTLIDSLSDQLDTINSCKLSTDNDYLITCSGTYDNNYSANSNPATRDLPAEYECTKHFEQLNSDKIKEYVNSKLPENLRNLITVSITENDNDAKLKELEPDWDSMPGGHDDY